MKAAPWSESSVVRLWIAVAAGFGVALSGWYPPALLEEVEQAKRLPQKLVLRCGTKDDLLSSNHDLVAVLQKRHAAFDYAEEPGAHTFHFWSTHTALMLTSVNAFFRDLRP